MFNLLKMSVMENQEKMKQLSSLAEALRAEKSKFNHHLLQNYVIKEFSDSVGLLDKRSGLMVKLKY